MIRPLNDSPKYDRRAAGSQSRTLEEIAHRVDSLVIDATRMSAVRELALDCLADPESGSANAIDFPIDPDNPLGWLVEEQQGCRLVHAAEPDTGGMSGPSPADLVWEKGARRPT